MAATLLVAILGSAACAGEGSDEGVDLESSEESADSEDTTTTEPEEAGRPTKEEVAAALGGDTSGVSDDDATCVGLAMVDAVGLDVLLDTGAFERMDDESASSLADLGITLDESQKAALVDGLHECGDLRTMMKDAMSADGSIPPEGAACMVDGLDDTTVDRFFVTAVAGGEAALDADSELLNAVTQATLDCIAAGVNMGE